MVQEVVNILMKFGKSLPVIAIVVAMTAFFVPQFWQTAEASLKDVTGVGNPSVNGLTVDPEDSKNFRIKYQISGGINKLRTVLVTRTYRKNIDDTNKPHTIEVPWPFTVQPNEIFPTFKDEIKDGKLNALVDIVPSDYTCPTGSLPQDCTRIFVDGIHTFSIQILGSGGELLDSAHEELKIYTDEFVESYSTNKKLTSVKTRKINALGNSKFGRTTPAIGSKTRLEIAWNELTSDGNINANTCVIDPSTIIAVPQSCDAKEVNLMYEHVLRSFVSGITLPEGKTVDDLLKIDCFKERDWLNEEKLKETHIIWVCDAKDRLIKKLTDSDWVNIPGE